MATYSPSKITKDGNTYNFTDATKIPLSGSNQISGSLIPATDNSIDIGSSTNNIKTLYTKGITIDDKTIDTDANDNMTYDGHIVDTFEEQGNGYIRYSNGLQICWGVIPRTQFDSFNNHYGNLFSFPKSFITEPAVNITQWRTTGNLTQNVNIYYLTSSTFGIETDEKAGVFYIAIGTWK